MSWSVEYTTFNEAEIRFIGDDTDEAHAAMKSAVDAVSEILASGALGDPEVKRFAVSISGHSNVGNTPVPGFSNDYMNVNIFQMNVDED